MSDRMPPKLNRNASVQGPIVISSGFHSLNDNGTSFFLNFFCTPLSCLIFSFILGTEASPLKLFSRAKNAINSIYHEFYSFIDEIYGFLDCNNVVQF